MLAVPPPSEWSGATGGPSLEEIVAAAAPDPEPSCDGEVTMAAAASLAWCLTPFAGPECRAEAIEAMELGQIMCAGMVENLKNENIQATALAMLTPQEIEEIEPELLMPLLDPLEELLVEPEKPEPEPESAAAAEKKPERPPIEAQIVEITRPENEKAPDSARFVSEYDSSVERETVARGSTEEMVERPGPRELTPSEAVPDVPPDGRTEIEERPPGEQPNAPDNPGQLSMRRPGPVAPAETSQEATEAGERDGSEAIATSTGTAHKKGDGATTQERRDATEGSEGEGGGGGGTPDVPDLRPSEEMLERVVGGGSVDKLDGVEDDELTGLNTVKWKHASFFNRVKRMVAQNWEPWKVYQARDPHGNVYGHKTKVTRVKVSMKPTGVVTKIYVVEGSGVDFLDDEAVRAFRAAGPFPNPPEALIDAETNLITFSFSFHVEIGKDSSWKIFRHR